MTAAALWLCVRLLVCDTRTPLVPAPRLVRGARSHLSFTTPRRSHA